MRTQSEVLPISPVIANEISVRLLVIVFIVSTEYLSQIALQHFLQNHLFYIAASALAMFVFVTMPMFGDSKFALDIQELCFYDFLAQLLGLILYLLYIEPTAYLIIANAILILKGIRLFWMGKSTNAAEFTGWPIFGIIGFYRAKQSGLGMPPISRSDARTYFFIAAGISMAALLNGGQQAIIFSILATVMIIYMTMHVKKYVASLREMRIQPIISAARLETGIDPFIVAQHAAITRDLQLAKAELAAIRMQQKAMTRGLKLTRPSLLSACDQLPYNLSAQDKFSLCYFITHGASIYMLGEYFPMLSLEELKALTKHHRPEKKEWRFKIDKKLNNAVFKKWNRISQRITNVRSKYVLLHRNFPNVDLHNLYFIIANLRSIDA